MDIKFNNKLDYRTYQFLLAIKDEHELTGSMEIHLTNDLLATYNLSYVEAAYVAKKLIEDGIIQAETIAPCLTANGPKIYGLTVRIQNKVTIIKLIKALSNKAMTQIDMPKNVHLFLKGDQLCKNLDGESECYLFRQRQGASKRLKIIKTIAGGQTHFTGTQLRDLFQYHNSNTANNEFKRLFHLISNHLDIPQEKLYRSNNNGYTITCNITEKA